MVLPTGIDMHETKTGFFWIESDGILCSITKKNAPKLSPEESEIELKKFYNLMGNEKRCILIDAKYAKPNSPEERKEAAEVLPKLTKALAIIVHNALGRMLVNLFIGLEKPPYPMKIFKPNQEDEAREWLRTYL